MSQSEDEGPMKEGTNSFYCSDEEMIAEVNSFLQDNPEYRSLSHFISSCVREKVESEQGGGDDDVVDVEIENGELSEYVSTKHEDGEFFDEKHVVTIALERMRKDDKGDMLV